MTEYINKIKLNYKNVMLLLLFQARLLQNTWQVLIQQDQHHFRKDEAYDHADDHLRVESTLKIMVTTQINLPTEDKKLLSS